MTYFAGKKAKLRTSKDIYNRLKWDFDSISGIDDIQLIYIGYKVSEATAIFASI